MLPPPCQRPYPMSDTLDPVRQNLRELERTFVAFERGDRGRLYESRDAIASLTEAIEKGGSSELAPLCEIASRLLGILLMEGGLSENRSVQVVRELLGYVEQNLRAQGPGQSVDTPGGVFHVVNSERIGEMLIRKGFISADQLDKALLLQRVSKGKRVGEVLIAMNAIDQRTLDSALESQRDETRREETRRGHGGSGSAQAGSIPPLPGAPQASPTIPLSSEPIPPIPQSPPPYGQAHGALPELPPLAAPPQGGQGVADRRDDHGGPSIPFPHQS